MPALSHQIPGPRKKALLQDAEEYALQLVAAEVGRNEWLRVLDIVEAHPNLEEASDLVQRLPTSWVVSRSKTAPKQWRQIVCTFDALLKHRLPDVELRFILGWTARLLFIREQERKAIDKAKRKQDFRRNEG